MRARPTTLLTLLVLAGCKTGSVDPGNLDGSVKDAPVTWLEQGMVTYDLGPVPDAPPGGDLSMVDLTANPNDPCTYGKCGAGLICMANICHAICSTGCGDKAPECLPTEGCHWVTSFSAACLPGSAKYPEPCGNGTFCIGGNLCVQITGKGTMCLQLCKYGCPSGTKCGETNNGCKVCVPY